LRFVLCFVSRNEFHQPGRSTDLPKDKHHEKDKTYKTVIDDENAQSIQLAKTHTTKEALDELLLKYMSIVCSVLFDIASFVYS
jgi:hypothetical protein